MARLFSPQSKKIRHAISPFSEGLDKWDYLFDGNLTPIQAGWAIATNTVGDSVQSIVDNNYKVTAAGASSMRLNFTYPDAGSAGLPGAGFNFSQGATIEWRAIYALSVAGVAQSNIYIGDADEIIRILYTSSGATVRWSTTLLYTDSTTNVTNWHIYKLVILGTTCQYYVDGVLLATVTRGNTGSTTNYIRIDHRNDAGGTFNCTIDYIRARKGTDSTTSTFKRKLTS